MVHTHISDIELCSCSWRI